MTEIDREPPANIRVIATPLEGSARLALLEIPTALKDETSKEEIIGIGRNRFVTKIKDSVNRVKRRGGSGRSRRNRGCGSCGIETSSFSACMHSGIPGLRDFSTTLFYRGKLN